MKYATINPVTNFLVREYPLHPCVDLEISQKAFISWRKLSVEERGEHLSRVAALLEKDLKKFAQLITLEMGKPLREAEYELNKCLTAFDYYITQAPGLLKDKAVKTNASESFVRYEPMGIVLSVMPWNFPFWQVFRFAIPTLITGNVTILKHAPNVPGCAAAIEQLFIEAGTPPNIFRNYYLTNEDTGKLFADPRVVGISFTGSDETGSFLAEQAGRNIKKCVLELGGNDAFIVLEDAELDATIVGAIKSRSINSGQSCNAAKRFIVVEKIADEFIRRLNEAVCQLKVGNPEEEGTQIGPLARKDLAEKVRAQVEDSLLHGASASFGVEYQNIGGNYITPMVLTNVKPGMKAFDEEIFGPVWSVVVAKDEEDAIKLANDSIYGLGASIWTKDIAKAKGMISELEAGNVFINDIVKSDPRLPFGGVKRSGFGRELSEYGLKEFVNIKTVYLK
ncbi:MAG: NAD-dependent succinate-semialdehyde dehydrogenase [Bacteroidetes bacterium]|nr:NAD-dependent succinate-semialdehyde dehydrogenase [Bacteroidota bacterium]